MNNMGKLLESYSKRKAKEKAKYYKDKIMEKNGKIYIFPNIGTFRRPIYDNKPNVFDKWSEAIENSDWL